MRAVDTNVLVRLFIDDNSDQHHKVKEFFANLGESDQIYVSLIVVTELVWVLESSYEYSREVIAQIIEVLLETGLASFQNSVALFDAMKMYKNGADFADSLITALAIDAGCSETLTFDRKATKKAKMTLLN